jgi:hypothetical protein
MRSEESDIAEFVAAHNSEKPCTSGPSVAARPVSRAFFLSGVYEEGREVSDTHSSCFEAVLKPRDLK